LSRANEELARSNHDLQQFAYVASHDLQEPLRAVAGFSELLQSDYGPQLDETAREYLAFTVDGARRMKMLIDNLLDFSRVQTQGLPLDQIDSRDALQVALDNLREAIGNSGATVTPEGLGPVLADAAQLTQVFQNLISNAIKFRREAPPEIHIRGETLDCHVQITVSDNGIGIEPEHAERIFSIFQRLHTQDTYPGTGIGLAICQRIVHRHGGDIWVESEPGQGSRFYFTWPRPTGDEAAATTDDNESEQEM
jgi:light-regulated signal transduction histidine kinase (bacteriophytochrome)